MELRNKFDDALKDKIGDIEADPSEKVWDRIRLATPGSSDNKKGVAVWWYAAAASIILLLLAGWFLLGGGNNDQQNKNLAVGNDKIETIDEKGDENEQNGSSENKNKVTGQDSSKNKKQVKPDIQILNKNPLKQERRFVKKEKTPTLLPQKEEPKETPLQEDKLIANEEQPQIEIPQEEELPAPQPDLEFVPVPEPDPIYVEVDNPIEEQDPEEIDKLKRRFNIPAVIEDVKQKNRGGVLASLAKGANQVLGLDTQYDEKMQEDITTKTFSADFKLFKIKRVKKVRNQ